MYFMPYTSGNMAWNISNVVHWNVSGTGQLVFLCTRGRLADIHEPHKHEGSTSLCRCPIDRLNTSSAHRTRQTLDFLENINIDINKCILVTCNINPTMYVPYSSRSHGFDPNFMFYSMRRTWYLWGKYLALNIKAVYRDCLSARRVQPCASRLK